MISLERLNGLETDRVMLINTARSELVERRVLEYIGTKHSFYKAGLDTPPVRPVNHPMIYYTPHIAGITKEFRRRMHEIVLQRIKKWFNNRIMKK